MTTTEYKELKEACTRLAKESFVWRQLKEQGKTDEECDKTSRKGGWENYLNAGGSTTMINHQLEREDDFGGQYDKLCIDAGYRQYICVAENLKSQPFQTIKEAKDYAKKWQGTFSIFEKVEVREVRA